MSSVAIVYRKDKLNKKGEAPIHSHIIKDRKVCYVASGIILPEENWDAEKNKSKASKQRTAKSSTHVKVCRIAR